MNNLIEEMKNYAVINHVPIITDGGLHYLEDYIKKHNIKNILEVGTAIGYSAICMCNIDSDITVTTIERDEARYLEAVKNIKKGNLEDRIELIFGDALEVNLEDKYDLIFIDAAKAQNGKFFERFEINLKDNGTIITDNMNFHGLVFKNEEEIESRNLRQLVRKVRNYKEFLISNPKYETLFLDIGDGLAVSVKK
ncbi:MAG: O-methyltransferase [Bacilli bacterium]|nr:O-methyltransferase [Bacilli bacterium]